MLRSVVLGYPFDTCDRSELLSKVTKKIREQEQFHITFANPEHVLYLKSHPGLQTYINSSYLNLADGIGIVWASRWLHPLKDRITDRLTGTDFAYDIAKICVENNWKLFIYGGTQQVNSGAILRLKGLYPDIKVSGIEGWNSSDEVVLQTINDFQPHVLMVCLGIGKQERWILENQSRLTQSYLIFGNGGAVDFLSGSVVRAPDTIHKFGNYGLEWLWRLFQDLTWKRIKKTFQIPYFMMLVVFEAISNKLKN